MLRFQGDRGNNGSTGATGRIGEFGMLGDPGERGERGFQGEPVSHDVLREYGLLSKHMKGVYLVIIYGSFLSSTSLACLYC